MAHSQLGTIMLLREYIGRLSLNPKFYANHLSAIIIRPRGTTLLAKEDRMNHQPLQELLHSVFEHCVNNFLSLMIEATKWQVMVSKKSINV